MYFAARCSTGCRQSSALSEEGQKDEEDDRKTHRERKEHQGIKYMAKILMMAGSTVVVLSLLGFLVLLLKGRSNEDFPGSEVTESPGYSPLRG
jgi:hypothetical protein